jgi:hypothetical protein
MTNDQAFREFRTTGAGVTSSATTPVSAAYGLSRSMSPISSGHHKRGPMSDDALLATRDLPDLAGLSLRELRRDTSRALDLALSRMLTEDATTNGASAGFQNRI